MPRIYIKITWKVKDPVWCNKTTSTGDGMDPWLVSFLPNNNYNWVECELSTWEHREHGINPAMIVKETIESKCWVRPVPQLEGHPTYKILVAPFPFSCVIIRLESVPIRGVKPKVPLVPDLAPAIVRWGPSSCPPRGARRKANSQLGPPPKILAHGLTSFLKRVFTFSTHKI